MVTLVHVKMLESADPGQWKSKLAEIVVFRPGLVLRDVVGVAGLNVPVVACAPREMKRSRLVASVAVRTGYVRTCAAGPIGLSVRTPVSAMTEMWKPRRENHAGTAALK